MGLYWWKSIAIFDGNWAKNVALVTKKVKRLFSKAKQSFWDFQWLLLVRWSAKHRNEEFFWWTEGEPKKLPISVRSTPWTSKSKLGNVEHRNNQLHSQKSLENKAKLCIGTKLTLFLEQSHIQNYVFLGKSSNSCTINCYKHIKKPKKFFWSMPRKNGQ